MEGRRGGVVATSTAVASAAAAFRSGELGGSESGGDVLGSGSLQ